MSPSSSWAWSGLLRVGTNITLREREKAKKRDRGRKEAKKGGGDTYDRA